MMEIEIPGREKLLRLRSLVLDYNGTIALDGRILPEAAEGIRALSGFLDIYVLTADTHGTAAQACEDLPVTLRTFPREGAGAFKADIVRELGEGVCAVGNGFNDIQMMDAAEFRIAVLDREGVCAALISHADILVRSGGDASGLLRHPARLTATMRS